MQSDEYKAAQRVIEVFDGDFPLYVYLKDAGKLTVAPEKLWVSVNDILVGELKNILGVENVVVKND
jgi:DNA polymerase-3 subunit alpha